MILAYKISLASARATLKKKNMCALSFRIQTCPQVHTRTETAGPSELALAWPPRALRLQQTAAQRLAGATHRPPRLLSASLRWAQLRERPWGSLPKSKTITASTSVLWVPTLRLSWSSRLAFPKHKRNVKTWTAGSRLNFRAAVASPTVARDQRGAGLRSW